MNSLIPTSNNLKLSPIHRQVAAIILIAIMKADDIIAPEEEKFLDEAYLKLGVTINDCDVIDDMDLPKAVLEFKQFPKSIRELLLGFFKNMALADGYLDSRELAIIDMLV